MGAVYRYGGTKDRAVDHELPAEAITAVQPRSKRLGTVCKAPNRPLKCTRKQVRIRTVCPMVGASGTQVQVALAAEVLTILDQCCESIVPRIQYMFAGSAGILPFQLQGCQEAGDEADVTGEVRNWFRGRRGIVELCQEVVACPGLKVVSLCRKVEPEIRALGFEFFDLVSNRCLRPGFNSVA